MDPGRFDHIVQLFDSDESLADSVAAFLREGLLRGDMMLVIIAPVRWELVASRMRESGAPIDRALRSGQVIVRNAAQTLELIRVQHRLDGERFDATVGAMVRQLTESGRRLRVYGELVELLAAEADYRGAHQVEEFWNALAAHVPFRLFCGYSAVHFGNPVNARSLRAICGAHTEVRSKPQDLLGTFLIATHTGQQAQTS